MRKKSIEGARNLILVVIAVLLLSSFMVFKLSVNVATGALSKRNQPTIDKINAKIQIEGRKWLREMERKGYNIK